MDMINVRVKAADGKFLDEFNTNAPDFADERVGRIRKYEPDLIETRTPFDSDDPS